VPQTKSKKKVNLAKLALAKPDLAKNISRGEEILKAATSVFARYGYRNADVQLIADEVGIGKGTIYRNFPTKQDLFFACVERGIKHLDERMMNCKDTSLNIAPMERLKLAVRTYFQFFEENADLVELFIQERAEFRDRQIMYLSHREQKMDKSCQFFTTLLQSEQTRDLSVESLDTVFMHTLYGTLITHASGRRDKPLSIRAEDIINVIVMGLLKHPS
jgi:AcrR family transcriptional regulator